MSGAATYPAEVAIDCVQLCSRTVKLGAKPAPCIIR